MPARVCVSDTDASLISSSLGNGAVDNAQVSTCVPGDAAWAVVLSACIWFA